MAFAVSVDAVDRFQVETNGAKAQNAGPGVSNCVLKSGTSAFHGAAFEYFRNTSLDARVFFPVKKPSITRTTSASSSGAPSRKQALNPVPEPA
jgi:hypothetical protein